MSTIVGTGPIDEAAVRILEPFGRIVISPTPDEATIIPFLTDAIGLVVRGGGHASAQMMDAAPQLRVIGRSGVGVETVDVAAATARNIAVVYAPGKGARGVAEAALTFMLALCKDIFHWDKQCKAGNWNSRFQKHPGDLAGATVGIVGLGNIGASLASLLPALRARVVAYDPYVSEERAASLEAQVVTLDQLLASSDFICLHAPLTAETRGLINRRALERVKPGAFLINLARGALVESLDVLHEALQDGRLAGVGLDVFDPEPPDTSHPIFSHPKCITAPHALGTSIASMREVFCSMAKDMAAVLSGRVPQFAVNPEALRTPRILPAAPSGSLV